MLHLYDSKSARVQPLNPVTPGKVGIYLCGATVQGSPHVGHLRAAVSFDTLIRWLRRSGYQVTYVRNVTDIDDKILNKSAEAGWDWWAWAYRFEREFTEAYETLGVQAPTYEPRATGHIPDQIDLVQRLIDAGHAYSDGRGNVYFDVHSQPDYGSLTRQRLVDMRTTEDDAQIDEAVEAGKRDPRDFALWKASKPSEPATASWDSPWGRGRPGWHLECSAMSRRYLGDEFDIHGGGIDLRFPHHENEQAQSHGAGWPFARLWVHNAWVTTKGEKMSKSVGNVVDPANLVNAFGLDAVRFFLMREVSFGQDGSYSEESIINRINSDLANNLGNLAQRSLSMVAKNCGGAVPAHGEFTEADRQILDQAAALYEPVRADFDEQAFHRALERIWTVLADTNAYFAEQEPWTLRKNGELDRMNTVLYVTLEVVRQVALLLQPVMPDSTAKLLTLLGVPEGESRQFAALGTALVPGTELPAPAPVFPRYEAPKA